MTASGFAMLRSCSSTSLAALLLPASVLSLPSCGPSNEASRAASVGGASDSSSAAAINEAVGLLGQFEFEKAAEAYRTILAGQPDDPVARLGLAIATLNQSRDGAQDEALVELAAILNANPPEELARRARYCQGLCLLYLGRAGEAVAAFVPVAEKAVGDGYAAYFAAQALEQVGEPAKALAWYERAAEYDPYLKSAQLGIQRCARRASGEAGEAKAEAALREFERLAENPRGRTAEFKYTRMGRLGLAPLPGVDDVAPPAPPSGPIFAEPREVTVHWPVGMQPAWSRDLEQHAATVDLDGDARLDLVIARGLDRTNADGTARNLTLVLRAREDGSFDALPDHPLAELLGGNVTSLLFGDIDSDGRTDVYACARGGNVLALATPEGGFRDATEPMQAAGKSLSCADGALGDLDHDGDLDLFLIAKDGPSEILVNNSNGTFRSLGAPDGEDRSDRSPRSVILSDLDYDRDVDIFVLNESAPHDVYINDRLWKWRRGTAPGTSSRQLDENASGAAVVELAQIPLRRVVLVAETFVALPTRNESTEPNPGVEASVADATGDGHPELFFFGRRALVMAAASGREIQRWPVPEGSVRTQLAMLDPTRGVAMLTLRTGAAPLVRDPGPGRGGFVAMSFSGRTDPSQSMRSNTSGIGTSWAARVGNEWFGGEMFRSHAGRGQSLAPAAVGVAPFERADFVEIEWSDGVFQTELSLPAGQTRRIVETQRQISSCPVVFAWNGERLAFVTDVLGVGGLGYLLEPGVYSEPRPWEQLVLPEGALVPKPDGTLALSLAEPMEESCMLDALALRAVDLPAGWDMAPDERLAIGGAAPTGELVAWRTEWMPQGSEALSEVDLVAADVGAHDPRFIGRLAGEQVVELEFGTAIDAIRDPWLVIDGWVEYPYCQTMFAAWQAGAKYRAPSLEARAADGSWVTLVAEWGYPAGMPRRMALPIPREGLPAGATALRMRTNMEVYFDSVRLVAREPLPVAPVELELVGAELASVGFARRSTGPQKQPHYDRDARLPLWDCRFQRGLYTEFGDVRGLLGATDGGCVVFGPGEEVSVAFAAPPQPQDSSARRRYVLESRGWCKDMDLFTRDGETIEPLPVPEPADAAKSRTRPMGGR